MMPKIVKIQERWLQIVLDNYESNYDALLHTSGKSTMKVKRFGALAIFLKFFLFISVVESYA